MFSKLLKHEWRSNAKTLGILSAAALGVGLLGGVVLRVLTNADENSNALAVMGMGTSMIFIVLALIAYVAAVEIILLARFYKNKFTDEGYLTFTLPVNSHQIFLSSFLNIFIWTLLASVVMIICVAAMLLLGGVINEETIGLYDEYLSYTGLQADAFLSWITVVQALVSSAYSIVLAMTCLTLGATWAKKHKILAAFGAYYLISMAISIVNSSVTVYFSYDYLSDSMEDLIAYNNQMAVVGIVMQLVIMALCYWLSTHLMNKKLNLN